MRKFWSLTPFYVVFIIIALLSLTARSRAQEAGQFIAIQGIVCDSESEVHTVLNRMTKKITIEEVLAISRDTTCTYGMFMTMYVANKAEYVNVMGDKFAVAEFALEDKHIFGWHLLQEATAL